MLALIIHLISGAVGGNAAGKVLKQYGVGPVDNSIVGVLGGGLCGPLLGILAPAFGVAAAAGGTDLSWIFGNIAGGGVGGNVLLVLVGLFKQMMTGAHAMRFPPARRRWTRLARRWPRSSPNREAIAPRRGLYDGDFDTAMSSSRFELG